MQNANELTVTILAVDDSVETLQIVNHALQRTDFNVQTAMSGEEALSQMAAQGLPHLIVCDLKMPPGMDGFEVCNNLFRWSDIPVIILTAVDEIETIVEALEQYAEDYIVKPFTPEELIARVRRVLLRIGTFPFPTEMPIVVDEHLSVNFPGRTLYVQGKEVTLTPTESRLLYLLMRRPRETIPYDYLLRRMWPHELVFEDRLHVFVHRLRTKLHLAELDHQYIILERGIGYRFNPLPVSEVQNEARLLLTPTTNSTVLTVAQQASS